MLQAKGQGSKPFCWSGPARTGFQDVKMAICTDRILNAPLPDQPFVLNSDTLEVGLGAVLLMQNMLRGAAHFLSKTQTVSPRTQLCVNRERGFGHKMCHGGAQILFMGTTICSDYRCTPSVVALHEGLPPMTHAMVLGFPDIPPLSNIETILMLISFHIRRSGTL